MALLLDEAHPNGLAGRIPMRLEPRIHLRQQGRIDAGECRADGNRHQHLLANRLAPGLDAPLIVPLAGPTEAGFE